MPQHFWSIRPRIQELQVFLSSNTSDQSDFPFGFISMVTNGLTDDVGVLLLHVAGIVAMVGPGPGERDLMKSTPVLQILVDEDGVVVGVQGLEEHRRGDINVAYGLL